MSKDFEQVTVQLLEVTNEWMYSNPTGLFNLSAADKAMRTGGGFQQMTYEQFKNIQEGAQTQTEEQPAENAEQEPTIDLQNALKRGAVLLKVQLLSRVTGSPHLWEEPVSVPDLLICLCRSVVYIIKNCIILYAKSDQLSKSFTTIIVNSSPQFQQSLQESFIA